MFFRLGENILFYLFDALQVSASFRINEFRYFHIVITVGAADRINMVFPVQGVHVQRTVFKRFVVFQHIGKGVCAAHPQGE